MQNGSSSSSRYYAFLLRLFQSEPEMPWQILLKTTDHDQSYLFMDTKALLEFLETLMETEQSK